MEVKVAGWCCNVVSQLETRQNQEKENEETGEWVGGWCGWMRVSCVRRLHRYGVVHADGGVNPERLPAYCQETGVRQAGSDPYWGSTFG
jgi:hypothetical protein